VRVEKDRLLATLTFVDEKANPTAETVWQGILQGSISGISIGFRSKSATMQKVGDRDVVVLTGNELVEISVVNLPANPSAVIERAKALVATPRSTASLRRGIDRTSATFRRLRERFPKLDDDTLEQVLVAAAQGGSLAEIAQRFEAARAKDAGAAGKAIPAHEVKEHLELALEPMKELRERAIAAEAEIERRDRAELIRAGRAAGKLTPAMDAWASKQTLANLREFITVAPAHPALDPTRVIEQPESRGLEWMGKTYSEMTYTERAELARANPGLFNRMRDDAVQKGAA
jgi:hypothetical protein